MNQEKLFCVTGRNDRKPIETKDVPHSFGYGITHGTGAIYFENKQHAKALRNLLDPEGAKLRVSRGPDHWKQA